MLTSENNDEYQDWLEGSGNAKPNPPAWFNRTLGEIQHAPLLGVAPDMDVATAVELMNDHHQSAVLVLERDKILGIFTERDVLMRVIPQGIDARRTAVRELMTPDPETLRENTLLSAALRTLALSGYHHLPVVDGAGKPRALVSLQTVVRTLIDVFPREIMNAPPTGEPRARAKEGA
jgi:CBS domain-containing protein